MAPEVQVAAGAGWGEKSKTKKTMNLQRKN